MSGSTLRWLRRIGIGAVVVLMAGFAVGSLAGSRKPSVSNHATQRAGLAYAATNTAAAQGGRGVAVPAPVRAEDTTVAAGPPATTKLGALELPADMTQVIKTADLSIEIAKGRLGSAWDRVFAIAAKYGGFVLSSSQGTPNPVPLG